MEVCSHSHFDYTVAIPYFRGCSLYVATLESTAVVLPRGHVQYQWRRFFLGIPVLSRRLTWDVQMGLRAYKRLSLLRSPTSWRSPKVVVTSRSWSTFKLLPTSWGLADDHSVWGKCHYLRKSHLSAQVDATPHHSVQEDKPHRRHSSGGLILPPSTPPQVTTSCICLKAASM
jgi:hypothetical protein